MTMGRRDVERNRRDGNGDFRDRRRRSIDRGVRMRGDNDRYREVGRSRRYEGRRIPSPHRNKRIHHSRSNSKTRHIRTSSRYKSRSIDRGRRIPSPHRNRRVRRSRSNSKTRYRSNSSRSSYPSSSPGSVLSKSPSPRDTFDIGGDNEEELMMKMMGFGQFNTTKNKEHSETDASGVNKKSKRKYRQYMNRKGGFNRPLSPTF